ncbi:BppU family phage baseplate upper protein [Clostridium thermarum]|uniref:BppU family phage baseplate upper protein n=1 Tax=Clostridium thermarum TaxID=1716543 RepID=UPI0013D5A201|nr:BppU family phage baseplate upper protein [Clostridium thermarum]
MESRYYIGYDIKKNAATNIKFKQGNIDTAVLEVSIFDNGLVTDITGEDIEFRFLKPDGTVVFQDSTSGVNIIDAQNGKVECVLRSETLAAPGNVKCEVHRSKDGKILNMPTFVFQVEGSIGEGKISENYIGKIENYIAQYEVLNATVQQYDERMNNLDSQLADIVQVNVKGLGKAFGDGRDDYSILQSLINANPNKTLYFPPGTFGISSPLIIDNNVNLLLHEKATIKALANMDYMVKWGKANTYPTGHSIIGGVFDGDGKAKRLVEVSWFRHFTIEKTVFKNGINRGLILRSDPSDNTSVEAILNNVYFENTIDTNLADNIALVVNTTDSHIENVWMVNWTVGVQTNRGGNRFSRVHPWIVQPDRLNAGSISFDIKAAGNIFESCLADSTQIGFNVEKDVRLISCGYFSNPNFAPDNMQVIQYHTTNNPFVYAQNCQFENQAITKPCILINKEAFNNKVTFKDCRYINIQGKPREKDLDYYITKPHESSNSNVNYNFATIKIPKENRIGSLTLQMNIANKNDSYSTKIKSCDLEVKLQGFKDTALAKNFNNYNVNVFCSNIKYWDRLAVVGKEDADFLYIDLYYKYYTSEWDYLIVKVTDIIGNIKTYGNSYPLDWYGTEHVVGNILTINDNLDCVGSITGYTKTFTVDYSANMLSEQLVFQNTYTKESGSGNSDYVYYQNGMVWGNVTVVPGASSNNAIVFTLSQVFRPLNKVNLCVMGYKTDNTKYVTNGEIRTNGEVVIWGAQASTSYLVIDFMYLK